MEFVSYKDSEGREVWLNPRRVSLILALEEGTCRVHLGDGHTVELRAAAAEVAKGVAAAAEPPPPPDPTLNLLS